VPDTAGLEQRQRPRFVVHQVERRIDQQIVGPQPVEYREVSGELIESPMQTRGSMPRTGAKRSAPTSRLHNLPVSLTADGRSPADILTESLHHLWWTAGIAMSGPLEPG
jgi:hypothetical protein